MTERPHRAVRERGTEGSKGYRAGEELGQGEGKGGSGPSQGLLPLIFSFSSFLIFHFLNFFFSEIENEPKTLENCLENSLNKPHNI